MTAAPAEPPGWPLRKWVMILGFIAFVQIGLIAWVGRKAGDYPRRATIPPDIHIQSGDVGESTMFMDPTLFVLPSWRGFSGPAWLQNSPLEFQVEERPEPPLLLTNNGLKLGAALGEIVRSELSRPLTVANKSEPRLDAVDYFTPMDLLPAQSVLRIEGGLSGRPLVRPLTLEPQPAANILSNSIVEVVVDAAGRVFSPPTLLQGCGLKQADESAIALAGSARFKPLSRSASAQAGGLTWGRMVFQWRTVPLPATNNPPEK